MKQEKHSLNNQVGKKKKKGIVAKETTNYMNNKLHIESKYASLISLIDTIYPPLLCTLCNTVSTSRNASNIHFNENHKNKARYLCIHPHCDQSFLSRGALYFHTSRSHLVNYSKKPLPDPSFPTLPLASPVLTAVLSCPSPEPAKTPPVPQHKAVLEPQLKATKVEPQLIATKVVLEPQLKATTIKTPPAPRNKQQGRQQKKTSPKREKLLPSMNSILIEDLTPSPPPSPFSLYHSNRKNCSKKPQLSVTAENFLNSMYPPLQCPACLKIFNRKTNVIKHLTESHLGQEPYKCIYPNCAHPRLYATREGLIYHIVRVHDND